MALELMDSLQVSVSALVRVSSGESVGSVRDVLMRANTGPMYGTSAWEGLVCIERLAALRPVTRLGWFTSVM